MAIYCYDNDVLLFVILISTSYFVIEYDCYIFIVIKIQPFPSIFPSVESMDRVFVVYHFGVSRNETSIICCYTTNT